MSQLSTDCVIAGGGPAGMMLGFLLARAGIDVTVLEKHRDFLRDFRGDTVHPSTLQIMHELGLLEKFLRLPHTKIVKGTIEIGERHFTIGDFSRLPTVCKFIALMPQWDFLNFLAEEAKRFPNFHRRPADPRRRSFDRRRNRHGRGRDGTGKAAFDQGRSHRGGGWAHLHPARQIRPGGR